VVWTSDEDYAELGRMVGPPLARGEAIEVERPARRKDGSSFLVRARGRAIDPTRPADSGTVTAPARRACSSPVTPSG
jgi:hypothetical protein